MAWRGRGRVTPLEARPLERRARRADAGAGAARHDDRDRRGLSRARHDRSRRGAPAELRADARRRRRHAPGDPAAHVGGGRVGGGRDRQAAAEERRVVLRRLCTGGRRRSHPPAPGFRLRQWCSSAWVCSPSRRIRRRPSARGRSGGFSARTGITRRRGQLAVDVPGLVRPRIRGQRPLRPSGAHLVRGSTTRRCSILPNCTPSCSRSCRPRPSRSPRRSSASDRTRSSRRGTDRPEGPTACTTGWRGRCSTSRPTQVTITRYQSLDPIGHYFLRYAMPSGFGDVTGRRAADARFGARESLRVRLTRRSGAPSPRSAAMICCSSCPVTAWSRSASAKRILERIAGDPEISGTHEGAPDGFLMAYGASVANSQVARGAHRSSTSSRLCSIFSACRLGVTWTGTRAPTFFNRHLPRSARSHSSLPTIGEPGDLSQQLESNLTELGSWGVRELAS